MTCSDISSAQSFVPTVLFIDDNTQSIDIIGRLVRLRTDWRLVTAMLGVEGIEIALALNPDLILLDLQLPDINGLEVLLRLRSDFRTADTPIVMVSAEAHQKKIDECLAAGANDYFVKPCDLHQLLAALEGFMSGDVRWTPVNA